MRLWRQVHLMIDASRIFEKSVKCVETLNVASADVAVSKFNWHIVGHSAFVSGLFLVRLATHADGL